MINRAKNLAKRHWPRLGLRTILLSTFIVVATLPGFGALLLRVYENTLVRQTESELIAEGAALAAASAASWPGSVAALAKSADYRPEPPGIDLRSTLILSERPAPVAMQGPADAQALQAAARMQPIFEQTSQTTLASIVMLDRTGHMLTNATVHLGYANLPEIAGALQGRPTTVLRRNAAYHRSVPVEWISRAADLRIHHARSIVVNGETVGALLLSRSPPPLYMGLYEDAGKIAVGVALILGVVIILSGLLSRGIVRPIERLRNATREVARGRDALIPPVPETAAVEIQALYRDFDAMAAAIDRRSRYLRDFAHAVSHEFKTPLSGIRGAIELLQDHHHGMSDSERRRFLGNAAVDADRLAQLVSRLLKLARADMMAADCEASDPLPPLRRVADAYSGANFSVDVLIEGALPWVAVPAGTVEAVSEALVGNARQSGATRCTIRATAKFGAVVITIRDNGPGVPAGDRDRLFEPFFTTRRAEGGTGLGLPIARSLLDACRGSIKLDAVDGATCFAIELPRS